MSDNSPASKYNFSNPEVVQIVEKNDGTVIGKNVSQQKQNLAEAAKEIQDLLVQLDRTYPNKTNDEKQAAIVQKVEQHIKQNPTLRDRLWSAFKAGGVEALKQALDAVYKNPVVSISVETIKGFLEAECSKP
jgi:gamma-glutamylcysteine synthetase